ncbi:trypsin-like, partial [Leucoraja erinacea]|uniref:trypsin-like n=1 Tax=Leucoraja erinaceus TaxID=7782 RepID=UPI002458DF86
QFIDAEMVIRHPKYDPHTQDNDIMLVKVSRPVYLNRNVPSQCAQTGDIGKQLKCLDTLDLSDADCPDSHTGKITDNMMCLGYVEGGRPRCEGDSVGPVVCNGALQGVGSWRYVCLVSGYPGVYTRVCNYVSWIHDTMAAN